MYGNFTKEARLVADGYTTALPSPITYSSIVSMYSIRISFILASLKQLDLFACHIGNAFLNSKSRENFGQNQAQSLVLKRTW